MTTDTRNTKASKSTFTRIIMGLIVVMLVLSMVVSPAAAQSPDLGTVTADATHPWPATNPYLTAAAAEVSLCETSAGKVDPVGTTHWYDLTQPDGYTKLTKACLTGVAVFKLGANVPAGTKYENAAAAPAPATITVNRSVIEQLIALLQSMIAGTPAPTTGGAAPTTGGAAPTTGGAAPTASSCPEVGIAAAGPYATAPNGEKPSTPVFGFGGIQYSTAPDAAAWSTKLRYDNGGAEQNWNLQKCQNRTVAYAIVHATDATAAWVAIQHQADMAKSQTITAPAGTEVTQTLTLGTAWVYWNSTCPANPHKMDIAWVTEIFGTAKGCVFFMPEYGAADRTVKFEQAIAVR